MRFCRWMQKKRVKRNEKTHTHAHTTQHKTHGVERKPIQTHRLHLWMVVRITRTINSLTRYVFLFSCLFSLPCSSRHSHSLHAFEMCTVLTLVISFVPVDFFNVCFEPKMSLIKKRKANKSNWWNKQQQKQKLCVRDVRAICEIRLHKKIRRKLRWRRLKTKHMMFGKLKPCVNLEFK